MLGENILELENRRQIYNFILKNPGIHMRELSRRMNIPYGTLKYHLTYLKKRELCVEKSDGAYLRYYVAKKLGKKHKEILNALRKEVPRKIILFILYSICASQAELSKDLEKYPSTIAFHLKKLQDMNIIEPAITGDGVIYRRHNPVEIERFPISNEKIYTLKNPKIVYDLVIMNKDSFYDDVSISAIVYWMMQYKRKKMPKRIGTPAAVVDSVYETLFDVFPHPYHV
ncbi:MAG: winged helix-turn-helix transcriptional regulator [Thermoplasmatales archaeon]|nr:MAG: winged helix-turn-helix transcriptional regulator [Thermoplasmatales archaeon]